VDKIATPFLLVLLSIGKDQPCLVEPHMKSTGAGTRVPLSPLHSIELAEGLSHLLAKPPEKDFPLYSIARKTSPDGRDLVRDALPCDPRQDA
jgi:hypothetical protein